MKKHQIQNKICIPTKPVKTKAKASLLLDVLLKGEIVNRKNLGDFKIGVNNDSAHSLVSILRNERLIPIESQRQSDGTANYSMTEFEIQRYKDPTLRHQQRKEMKAHIEEKRTRKINALIAKQETLINKI
tara:strand:+ start:9996 stop:10385 length:390 start_codon:yes stop_codon:yes gene_type:complete